MTALQKQIIKSITAEFEKINQPIVDVGLIDVAGILNNIDNDKKMKVEININNITMTDILNDVIDRDIEILNKDLSKIGIVAIRKKNFIVEIRNNDYPYGDGFFFYYKYKYQNKVINNAHVEIMGSFSYIEVYRPGAYLPVKFFTLQSLAADSTFINNIRKLYEITNK